MLSMIPEKGRSGLKPVSHIRNFIELQEQLQLFAVYVIYIETRNFEKEPTLADLHQKALFLPRSTLDQLEDIGHG